jgi:predicted nucleic acid-binding protein
LRCPLRLVSSLLYLPAALDVALRFRRSVYDALYVAVAVTLGGRCVTADKHLVNALAGSELAGHLWLLGANW